jgi:hypothetical protein
VQSVLITTKIVGLYLVRGEVYSIQHYVRQLLATGRLFSLGTPDSSTNITDSHDIIEILLKVALNTISQPRKFMFFIIIFFVDIKIRLILIMYEVCHG